jgi:hypothetical protein
MTAAAPAVPTTPPRLLSLRDVAAITGMGLWFLRAECQRGHLPYVKLSARALRVRQDDLDVYLSERRVVVPRTPAPQSPPVRKRTVKSRGRSA